MPKSPAFNYSRISIIQTRSCEATFLQSCNPPPHNLQYKTNEILHKKIAPNNYAPRSKDSSMIQIALSRLIYFPPCPPRCLKSTGGDRGKHEQGHGRALWKEVECEPGVSHVLAGELGLRKLKNYWVESGNESQRKKLELMGPNTALAE